MTSFALRLSLSVKTLRTWRMRGDGPKFHKFGRNIRYSITDLQAFEAASERTSTSDSGAVR